MLLKKQTVWLLTMLSLVVVLSIFYVTNEPPMNQGMPTSGDEKEEDAQNTSKEISDDDLKIITEASGDEVYEAIRMEVQERRGKMKEEYTMKIGSDELTADEKNELYEAMQQLDEITMKERVLETTIKGLGYSDALVEIEDNLVKITVKTDSNEHTKADAVEILQVVKGEISTNYIPEIEFDVR